jgi:hypothetical protein
MSYAIHKQTYSGGRAYRYRVLDEAGNARYLAEPTGLLQPTPTRLVEFFDSDHNRVGRLQPSEEAWWQHTKRYQIFVGDETEESYAEIRECLRLVDLLLLRLPYYEVQLGRYDYVALGNRYGERFYEIFRLHRGETEEGTKEPVGEIGSNQAAEQGQKPRAQVKRAPHPPETRSRVGHIRRPPSGPSYVIETDAPPLRQALTVLAALVILIDLALTA